MSVLPTEKADPYVQMLSALVRCTFPVGSWDKRFVRDLVGRPISGMTEKQRASIVRLVHKYRRQIPTEIIILAQDISKTVAKGAL
jgi:hypothetical protein